MNAIRKRKITNRIRTHATVPIRSIISFRSNNIYVTGYLRNSGTEKDYCTIKYDTDGVELWVSMYDGPISKSDGASAMAIDNSDNIYVTGLSEDAGFDNADYLLEAKWQEKDINASDLYTFGGKIQGKLKNTLGLFVSLGPDSSECAAWRSRSLPPDRSRSRLPDRALR